MDTIQKKSGLYTIVQREKWSALDSRINQLRLESGAEICIDKVSDDNILVRVTNNNGSPVFQRHLLPDKIYGILSEFIETGFRISISL